MRCWRSSTHKHHCDYFGDLILRYVNICLQMISVSQSEVWWLSTECHETSGHGCSHLMCVAAFAVGLMKLESIHRALHSITCLSSYVHVLNESSIRTCTKYLYQVLTFLQKTMKISVMSPHHGSLYHFLLGKHHKPRAVALLVCIHTQKFVLVIPLHYTSTYVWSSATACLFIPPSIAFSRYMCVWLIDSLYPPPLTGQEDYDRLRPLSYPQTVSPWKQ